MLKKLRHKKTSKRILIVLAAVIIPAFAFWGFSSVLHGPKENASVGKLFGKNVSAEDFKGALNAVTNLAIMRYGDDLSKVRSSLNLEAEAWQRLALLAEARRRNITAGDKEVIAFIEGYPFFQNKGQFNERTYNEMLQYVFHVLPRDFEEQTRQNLIISKLYRQVTENVKLTDQQVRDEYKKTNEELNLSYLQANPLDFAKDLNPPEQAMRDYFQKNQLLFKRPLSFNVEYVTFNKEEKETGAKLKDFLAQAARSADFTKLAKDYGLSPKETGLFAENDPIPGIGWSPQIAGMLSKANVGKVLSPIEADKFVYVLKLKERKEPFIPEFGTAKDRVKQAYVKEESKRLAREKINAALDKLKGLEPQKAKTVNFEQIAKPLGLKAGTTGFFKFGSYIEGIGSSDSFFTAAQNLKGGEFNQPIETPSGFFILKIKESKPIDEKKFAAEKDSFREKLLLQKKQESFSKFLEELTTRL